MTTNQNTERCGGKGKSFNNFKHNGIHLTFPNGNAISTIWGYGSYTDNYDGNGVDLMQAYKTFMSSDTVEIMIINAPEKIIEEIQRKFNFTGESVRGYVTMTEWLQIINLLAK